MQPITYGCVALVFFSCLTIAWAGALFEVIVPGLISAVFGGAVGGIFGAGNTFIAWVIVGIILSGVIHFAYSIKFASQILMPVLACSIGIIISAVIVSDLAKFYKHDSQSKYRFKSVQGAYLGAAIAGVIGTRYWAVMTAAIITAFRIAIQNLSKGFALYPAMAFISFVAVAGLVIGIVFRMTVEGNFTILIPNEPVVYDITDSKLFSLNRSTVVTGKSAFIFDYIDFHVDISKTQPSELMDTYISGFLGANEKTKVRDVTVDTYNGKEFEYQVQGVNAISRIFLVGQRLYILIVINPETDSYETFVNSLKLMP